MRRRTCVLLVAVALALALAACAGLPQEVVRPPSHAWEAPLETPLGRNLAPDLKAHPGASGCCLLNNGLDAFVARMVLAEAAERTLDVQYYIFHGDTSGALLLDALLRAAERGVRVRILVDDMYMGGREFKIAAFASHPNIEVRFFNPMGGRKGLARFFSFLGDFDRLNRRMHNKLFVADNAAAVTGGRNVGDEYFAARPDVNFADLDLMVAGPVVPQLSASFDAYWNSEWAFPVEAFVAQPPGPGDAAEVKAALAAHRSAQDNSEYVQRLRTSDLAEELREGTLALTWAPVQVVWDRPEKIAAPTDPTRPEYLAHQLQRLLGPTRNELILVSPYFVPGEDGMARFRELRARGVRIRILTNSLAANDVALVHSGYARYRVAMLSLGIELYELKPAPGASRREKAHFGSSGASLHAKSMAFDGERLFIGSLNLDPRSVRLNTEMGLLIESPELAETARRLFEFATAPRLSYRLGLRPGFQPDDAGLPADPTLIWTTEEDGRAVQYADEPDTTFWRRFSTSFLGLFAPEEML